MSQQIRDAYTQFLKVEKQRKNGTKNKQVASAGLLSPRGNRNKAKEDYDQFDYMIGVVNELRKMGANKREK